MPRTTRDDTKLVKAKKHKGPLTLHDYLTTEPRTRHTKAQQLEEARKRFLRDNR